jgi:hypothetical protein
MRGDFVARLTGAFFAGALALRAGGASSSTSRVIVAFFPVFAVVFRVVAKLVLLESNRVRGSYRVCPSPYPTHLSAVRLVRPIGPYAWSFVVEMPISAPSPSSPPSLKRVDAFTSTSSRRPRAGSAGRSRSSACRWPRCGSSRTPRCASSASSSEPTTRAARIGARNSCPKSPGVAGVAPGTSAHTAASPRSSSPRRERRHPRQERRGDARCTSRHSSALHTPGR